MLSRHVRQLAAHLHLLPLLPSNLVRKLRQQRFPVHRPVPLPDLQHLHDLLHLHDRRRSQSESRHRDADVAPPGTNTIKRFFAVTNATIKYGWTLRHY